MCLLHCDNNNLKLFTLVFPSGEKSSHLFLFLFHNTILLSQELIFCLKVFQFIFHTLNTLEHHL